MKLSIIIPVYNEARTTQELIKRVLAADLSPLEKEIIAVESNSTDGSREMIEDLRKEGKIKALYQDRPQGKGSALKIGLAAATGDIILIQDADLEYDIADYPDLLKPILEGRASFVLGSRHLGKSDWKIRKFIEHRFQAWLINLGGLLYATLFNALYGVKLTDPATMFKVFKRECMEGLVFKSNYFELDWEIVAKFIKKGFIPVEVPVSYASRSKEEGKKIRFFRDGSLVFLAILRFRFLN